MKRPSYTNKIILSVICILFTVIIILGTSTLVVMINDVNESEQLLNYSKRAYKDSIEIMFEDYDNISGSILKNSYMYLENVARELFDLYKEDPLSIALNYDEFIEGYFLVNQDGDIVKDTTGYFKGNILTMKDDANKSIAKLFKPNFDKEKNIKFEAIFDDKMYYSFMRKLNDEYMFGIIMSSYEAQNLYSIQIKETADLLPDTVVTDLEIVIIDQIGKYENFKYPKEIILKMIESDSDDVLEYRDDQNLLFYKIFNDNWLIIFESNLITEFEAKVQEVMNTQSKQLVAMSHFLVAAVIIIAVLLAIITKRIKRELYKKIKVFESNKGYSKDFADKIKYDEFFRVYETKKDFVQDQVVIHNNHDYEDSLFYVMGLIKQHYIQRYLKNEPESFKFSELLNQLISDLMIESTLFEVNIIDDTETNVYQNKKLIEGLMLYTIVNLLMYGNASMKNIIRIEAVEYQDQIIVDISRNKIHVKQKLLYEMIEELDAIDELIHHGLNGQIDYSKYETLNRSISIHIPKEKLTE